MAKILLIDDDSVVRKVLSKTLGAHHTVYTVEDWPQATSYIYRHKVDLILMDVEIPGVKGDKIARVLKETLKQKPPIILLFSSLDEAILSQKVVESSTDGYICKTFDKEKLLQSLDSFLSQRVS